MKLLVIEDELRIALFLVKGLKAQGYVVEHADSGAAGVATARRSRPDLVLLDLRLPDMDGLDVLRQLRGQPDPVPVLVLSARTEVGDRVQALDLGADDYLTKPFVFDELLARVRARLRTSGSGESAVLRGGGIELDLRTRRARTGARQVDLTPREFTLLETFLRHVDQVLSRAQLLSQAWSLDVAVGTNVVDVYVGYLRRKLGETAIETVRGIGYRLPEADPPP
ncbi:MAG TPA: response regulator transcription factor [Gaiellaceae bacterium]|nr:response regulator transcription factor [Gaiellaceae bacterium]